MPKAWKYQDFKNRYIPYHAYDLYLYYFVVYLFRQISIIFLRDSFQSLLVLLNVPIRKVSAIVVRLYSAVN